jgi:hypothetical protein
VLKSGQGGVGGDDLDEGFRSRVLRQWLYVDDGCGWVVARLWGWVRVFLEQIFFIFFYFFVGRSL